MVRRKKRKPVAAPALRALRDTPNADAQNRLLLAWLEDDRQRRELYALVNQGDGELTFPSRDSGQREDASHGLQTPRPPPVLGHAAVTLVTRRAAIDAMLRNKDTRYSSRVYTELGGGSFMLALDPKADDAGDAHCAQRKAYRRCFPDDERGIQQLAYAACQDASIMSLRAVEFDLASFAEQAALRFCQKLMGYSFGDHALLEATLRDAYAGLVYQVFGRHFTSDPLAMPKARQALARLVSRTSRLIDAYAANDADELKGRDQSALRFGVQPVLAALGADDAELNGEQRAIIAVGAAVGTVGNVQAAACIAVQHLFSDPGRFTAAQALACRYLADEPTESARWKELIEPALRADPPIPFLPRIEVNGQGKAVREFLLALGGGTQGADAPAPDTEDPLIWGLPDGSAHACAGRVLAWPLIAEIVRHVMRLP
ncbi:MAG TPA: hypothetical protein VEZ89_02945, partial [Rubrivivax sp.]|nr:hypothetical protein [Rubrivivax sp.]